MVTAVTSFGRSGTSDWLVQRVSAAILLIYTVFILCYFVTYPDLQYVEWRVLHTGLMMRLFNSLALLSVAAHSWIGLWSVTTDYLTRRAIGSGALWIRLPVQFAVILTLLVYLVLGFGIIWG